MRKLYMWVCIALIVSFAPLGMGQAHAQEDDEYCFNETHQCIAGPIRTYWEHHGGLPVFGYPITEQRTEIVEGRQVQVQWFERDRLEYHSDDLVLAGRLGVEVLEDQQQPWQSFPTVERAAPGCEYFPDTGHSLCEPFLRYWQTNGGLERFGYPITEPFQEEIQGTSYTVQYFERRRMEYHPEHADTPHEIQLGLLGRYFYPSGPARCYGTTTPRFAATVEAYREKLGCGLRLEREVDVTIQPFERGTMIALSPYEYAVTYVDHERDSLVYKKYSPDEGNDTTQAPQNPTPGLQKPDPMFEPIWSKNPAIHSTIGWATGPAQFDKGVYQMFQDAWALYRVDADRVYIFYHDGRADDIPCVP